MSAIPGPKMRAAVEHVAGHPGCSKAEAGDWYPVDRAIRRGFIREERGQSSGTYRLFLTDAGRAYLA